MYPFVALSIITEANTKYAEEASAKPRNALQRQALFENLKTFLPELTPCLLSLEQISSKRWSCSAAHFQIFSSLDKKPPQAPPSFPNYHSLPTTATMGQVCSGLSVSKNVNTARDPADKELDAIEMRETKLPDFDAFFEQAAGPLNGLVEIHNAIVQSEENLKSAAAAIQGEVQVRLNVSATGRVDLELWKFDVKGNEYVLTHAEVEEKLAADAALRDAFDRSEHAIANLNLAAEQPANLAPTQFTPKRGRLFVTTKGSQDALVRDVNVAVFTLRKQLALAANVSLLSQGIIIFIKELAKVEELGPLSVETDEDGTITVMCGEQELNLRKMGKLSEPVVQLRDALVALLENVQTAATSLPELSAQCATFCEEAQTFPGKVPDAVQNSDLGVTALPKVSLATSANVKALAKGPTVAQATTAMIQYAGSELKQAVSIPLGG